MQKYSIHGIVTGLKLSTCRLTVDWLWYIKNIRPFGTCLPTVDRTVEALVRWVTTGFVLWGAVSVDVVLIVHAFSILPSMMTSANLIRFIKSLCFDKFIDLSTDKPHQGLLGESMTDRPAYQIGTLLEVATQ
jgi:hypothetical protein